MTDEPLTIPAIPPSMTPEQREDLALHFQRLALIVANDNKNRLAISEIHAWDRHDAVLKAAQDRHDAAHPPFSLGDLAAALSAHADIDVPFDRIEAVARERWAGLQRLMASLIPATVPAPVPAPVPEVEELDPVWYLAELTDEFVSHTPPWPATLEGARQHWLLYGKPQGRRGRAGGPGWGPKAEDAPPGTVL